MTENFKVIKGEPTEEELAAVIMVLTAQASRAAEAKAKASLKAEWNAPHRGVRKPFEHGRGTWRRSALPHPY